MFALKIILCTALITSSGIAAANASNKAPAPSLKTHAEVSVRAKVVTVSSEKRQLVFKPTHFCSTLQGVSYGAALVGLQSVLIVLPSFASGVGAPVAAIATGIGTFSSGVGFVAMVAHDVVCK